MSVCAPVAESDPQRLDPLSVQRSLRLNFIAGSCGSIFLASTGGAILNAFALHLNASLFQIALMGAIPLFALSAQIIGAFATEMLRERKRYWMLTCGLHRVLWVPILLIPYVLGPHHPSAQIPVFLALLFLSWGLLSASAPAWLSWMADVVPERSSGRFWGRRSAVTTLVFFIAGVPLAMLIDRLRSSSGFAGYALIFAIGVIFGVIDILLHRWIKHPPMHAPQRASIGEFLLKPLRNREFRQFLLLTSSWNFAVQLFVPFINVYFLQYLHMTLLHIALLNLLFGVSILVFSKFWGYLIDHFGKRPVIEFLIVLKFITPGAYLFTNPNFFWPVLIPTYIFDGFMVAGLNPAFQAATLSYSPRENKSIFIAMYNALMGLFSAIGPICAGLVMKHMPDFSMDYGPLHWKVIHLAFLGSVVVRLLIWPLGRRLTEPGSGTASDLMRTFFDINPFRVVHHLNVLAESSDPDQRVRSAQALRRKPGAIAVERLLEAIHDPNREVRAAAALALGQVECPESIEALLYALRSPELDIQQPAARALGALATPECIDALIQVLMTTEDATLRGHVARVLGESNSSRATKPLINLMQTDHSSNVLASAAEALSRLGEVKALRAILPQMRQIEEPVVRAQVAVAIGNLLGEDGEFYAMLAEEKRATGLAAGRLRSAIFDDLRMLPSDVHGAGESLWAMEEAYLSGDYAECCRHSRQACNQVFGMEMEVEDTAVGFVDQMRLFVLAEPKLGIQMWFLLVMGSEQWRSDGPVGSELALLAQYALSKIVAALRKRPQLLQLIHEDKA